MIENQNGKRILLLGVYGMELVECGGALLKNAKSGGVSHASMLFCGEQMRKDLAKSAEILQTTVEYLNMDSGAVTGSREERLKIATVIRKFKPDIIITQDPEHCVSDLDPDSGRDCAGWKKLCRRGMQRLSAPRSCIYLLYVPCQSQLFD